MSITAARPFKGRQYSGEVILTAVRWYLRYPLAYEHVAELLAERGFAVDAQLHMALGASIRSGVEQAMSPTSKGHQQELPRG